MKTTKDELETPVEMVAKEGGEVVDLSGVKSFEDLLEVVGTRGPWNIMLFIIATYTCFASPMVVMSYQFLGATPDHWCRVGPLVDANWTQQQVLTLAIPYKNDTGQYDPCHMYDYNYTAAAEMGYEAAMKDLPGSNNHTITCPARDFNHTQYQSTVVTEWDLVCERRVLYSSTQGALSIGGLLGTLFTGFLFDRYGRRSVLLILLVIYILFANIIILSPNIYAYIAIRCLVSFCDISMYIGVFVLVLETCATRYRSIIGALTGVPWAIGYMVLPGIAYIVRTWRMLSVSLAVPLIPLVLYFWFLPESPRWLMQGGNHTRALAILKKAAKANGKKLPSDPLLLKAMAQVTCKDEDEQTKQENDTGGVMHHVMSGLSQFVAPFVRPELRFRTLVYINWTVGSLIYYGMAFMAINLNIDPYLYIFLGGLLELPSHLTVWVTIEYLGRRKAQVLLYLMCAVCILSLMTIMLLSPHGNYSVRLGLSLCGKMLITAVYQLTWVYTTELFPTEYRSIAVSQGQFMESVAGMVSPYINDLLGEAVAWIPTAVFGCSALVAALVAWVLPETKGMDLPELDTLTKPVNKDHTPAGGDQESEIML